MAVNNHIFRIIIFAVIVAAVIRIVIVVFVFVNIFIFAIIGLPLQTGGQGNKCCNTADQE